MDTGERSEAHFSAGATRAARVLAAVARRTWTLSGLARHLEVDRRTLGRVVSGLEREGFVSRNRAGLLQAGPAFIESARLVAGAHGLAALAHDVVSRLSQDTGCTTMLHLPHGDYVFPEIVIVPEGAVGLSFPRRIGIELWRGIGRAILQHSTPAEVRRLSARTSQNDLAELVEKERQRGYAVSQGEIDRHVVAIGAPVLDGDVPVGVLTVLGLDPDIPERHGDVLLASAQTLSGMIRPDREA